MRLASFNEVPLAHAAGPTNPPKPVIVPRSKTWLVVLPPGRPWPNKEIQIRSIQSVSRAGEYLWMGNLLFNAKGCHELVLRAGGPEAISLGREKDNPIAWLHGGPNIVTTYTPSDWTIVKSRRKEGWVVADVVWEFLKLSGRIECSQFGRRAIGELALSRLWNEICRDV